MFPQQTTLIKVFNKTSQKKTTPEGLFGGHARQGKKTMKGSDPPPKGGNQGFTLSKGEKQTTGLLPRRKSEWGQHLSPQPPEGWLKGEKTFPNGKRF